MEPGIQGAGGHILKGRHVIGLFFLMMLLSAMFFTLGYVMGRNQYDDHVYAMSNHIANEPGPPDSDWEFYHAPLNQPDKKPDNHNLKVPPERTATPKTTATATAAPNEKSAANLPPLSKYAENARKRLKRVAFKKRS